MSFKVSTTGLDVTIADLGLIVEDPTVDRDLALEFTPDDLSESEDLTQAIKTGNLELKIGSDEYGEYIVDPTEYYAGLAVQNQLIETEEENYITEAELSAGAVDTLIHPEATAVPVTSTANATSNVYATTAKFQKWKIAPGDKAVITGGPAAGTYTIASGIDQQQFQTVESIPDTAVVGTLQIFHPTGSTKIGVDPTGLANSSSTDLQSVLEDLDSAITGGGLTESQHADLDTLLHNLNENIDLVPIFNSDGIITSITARNQSGSPDVRAVDSFSADSDGLITGFRTRQFDGAGSPAETLTYSGTNTASIPQELQVDKT